ncbi:phytoene desaturase family protein [Streptomyces muensis]|uniref:Pyridine nucleotide-disulfide oxidoreductase domain-containing protein 2 n=1 Tax=Streptomyces muensis TaxID=1077944 RepID=A0A9X1PT42_STRM4|nr:NAD(P)/FAD-dependent oxidoreductase [Streptomyces muensis]MCF1592531.1 NAD(P)/FAD-dependent oxidoreductase [Streptomyces muensis]
MPEQYDGVIIGSGQHGLILGTYLAKAGLKILLLERRLIFGGGLSTTEVTKPGFYHQMHSVNHFNITQTPWYKDLELANRVRYVTPRYDFAQPHRDGTALVFSRYIDETCESIARFSKKDAQTYREWNAKADLISDHIFWPERYSEPLAEAERDELLSRSSAGRDFLEIINRQPLTAVNELFEEERVRLLLLFKMSLFGTVLYDQVTTRSPMGALVRGFDLVANYQVAQGGSVALARSLMERYVQAGGEFRSGAHVERIVVDQGRATGVQLADGTVINSRFVASTVDVPQTFLKMVGEDQLPAPYADKVRAFKQTAWTLFGLHLALEEAPRHIGTDFDPHVNEALKVNVGCESMEQLFDLHDEVAEGKIPSRISFGTGSVTQFDPSQAPDGKATAYAWHAMPYAPDGDPESIEAVKEEFADRMIETWREWAPNLTSDNILARHIYTANDYTKELVNMVEGDIFVGSFSGDQTMWNHFGYRTPIEGLYMAGSPTHPGGAISGGGGYIASRIIAEDYDVPLWWTPVDARASLEKLAGR